MKKKNVHRYWVCWRSRRRNRLCEILRVKRPAGYEGAYVENLETGEVIQNDLSFRSLGEMRNRIERNGFCKRRRAENAIKAKLRKESRETAKKSLSRSPYKKLTSALVQQKNWTRKLRLATTKLKKLRARIKRLQASAEGQAEQSATESPHPQ